jgi:hypothetical protein
MKDEALKLALEALENSVDLVREDAYNAEKLYGNYPTRQGKVRGLKVLADDHENAITAIKQALSAPVQEATAAINTLKFLGYTYHGGEQWKPPLGECPAWLNEPAPVQEPVAWIITEELTRRKTTTGAHLWFSDPVNCMWTPIYTTPPAAAVPDALNPKDEHPAYATGWNDCRAEMLKGMKP